MKKKKDGFYYFKPFELDLKSVSGSQIEFGTEKTLYDMESDKITVGNNV